MSSLEDEAWEAATAEGYAICTECGDDLAAAGHVCCTECMERALICPECRAGKYPNCTREAMDPDEDVLVPCEGWKVAPA